MGAVPNVENALTKEQIRDFRRFIVEQRRDAPLFIIDTYWDDKGKSPMSGGDGYEPSYISVGAVEFFPPLQMARDFINGDASNLVELFRDSRFWRICGK